MSSAPTYEAVARELGIRPEAIREEQAKREREWAAKVRAASNPTESKGRR